LHTEPSDAALDALRAVLRLEGGLALDAAQEADVLAYMMRTGLRPDNPIVVAFVDLLRVKAEIIPSIRAAVRDGILEGVAAARALPPTPARVPLAVQPSAAAAGYVAATAAIAAAAIAVTWATTTSSDLARAHADNPHATALLATRGGRAAGDLLRANGDALAAEIQHCRRYADGGRPVMTCTFWASGTAPNRTPTAAELALDAAASLPAWQLVALELPLAVGATLLVRSRRRRDHARP
jgi:hypothetical protein